MHQDVFPDKDFLYEHNVSPGFTLPTLRHMPTLGPHWRQIKHTLSLTLPTPPRITTMIILRPRPLLALPFPSPPEPVLPPTNITSQTPHPSHPLASAATPCCYCCCSYCFCCLLHGMYVLSAEWIELSSAEDVVRYVWMASFTNIMIPLYFICNIHGVSVAQRLCPRGPPCGTICHVHLFFFFNYSFFRVS